jgi:hypothetical protein
MLAKIALAVLIGAVSGMFAAYGGGPWPPAAGTQTSFGARTVACVETAWHALRHHRAP